MIFVKIIMIKLFIQVLKPVEIQLFAVSVAFSVESDQELLWATIRKLLGIVHLAKRGLHFKTVQSRISKYLPDNAG